jgi:hypothetical protein
VPSPATFTLHKPIVSVDQLCKEDLMARGLLLWLIGIPLPIILLIWLLGGLN